jgi:hypothetical protein
VGLPRNFFRSAEEVAAVADQSLRSRSCLSIYFLATLQLLLSFHHFTPFRHLRHSIASSVRASEPLHIQELDSISQLTQFEKPQTWVKQWWA